MLCFFGVAKLAVSKQIVLLSLWPIFYFDFAVSHCGVRLAVAGKLFNEQHWNLVSIVFIVAKLYVSDAKFVSGKQKYF